MTESERYVFRPTCGVSGCISRGPVMSRSAAFEIGRTLIGQAAFAFSADFTAFGFRSMTRRYATNAIYALRIRRERARRLDEQRRERGFDAVTDEPAYARRVVPLPR